MARSDQLLIRAPRLTLPHAPLAHDRFLRRLSRENLLLKRRSSGSFLQRHADCARGMNYPGRRL